MSLQTETNHLKKNLPFDFVKLLFIIYKSIPFILVIFVFSIAGCIIFLRYTKNVYEASSTIQLQFKSSRSLLNVEMNGFEEGIDAINLSSEISLIRSRLTFNYIVDSVKLRVGYYKQGEVLSEELFPTRPFSAILSDDFSAEDKPIYVRIIDNKNFEISFKKGFEGQTHSFDEEFEFAGSKIKLIKEKEITDEQLGLYYFKKFSLNELFNLYSRNLKVEISNESSQALLIKYRDFNRYKCVEIVRFINKIYLYETIRNKNITYEQNIAYLNGQIQSALDSIEKLEQEFKKYRTSEKEKNEKIDLANSLLNKIEIYQDKRSELRFKYQELNRVDSLIKLKNDSAFFIANFILKKNGFDDLDEKLKIYNEAKQKFEKIKGSYGSTSTAFRDLETEMNRIEVQFYQTLVLIKLSLIDEISVNGRKISEIQGKIIEDDELDEEYKKLKRYLEIYQLNLNSLQTKLIEIGLVKSGTVANHRVLDAPYASSEPVYPNQYLIYGLGLFVAFFLSFTLVAVKYFLYNTIDTVKEIEQNSSIPIIGWIPKYEKANLEFSRPVVHLNPKSGISESFRAIRTSLDFMAYSESKKKIAVTSTVSGEGKTFIATNLACIIAMSGKKVIIIDLDMRKPKIHKAFDCDNSVGLSTLLIKKTTLDQVIRHSEIENLDFITSGTPPPNPSELIVSQLFQEMESNLEKIYDFIIFDTPPIGMVTDGVSVFKSVSHPIYVLRAGISKIQYLKVANKLYDSNSIVNLSIVMNAVKQNKLYGGYGYGYAYGYGYGYGYGSSEGYYSEEKKQNKFWSKVIGKRNNM